jgi:putative CocE/NonD family hydrolase
MYCTMRDNAATPEARRGQKLIMGPWAHLMPYAVPTSRGTGDIDFGPEAKIELHAIQLRWFDQHLKGLATGILEEPPVRLFVMGENRWRDESEWPLKRTTYTKVFLHSRGGANTSSGNGSLSLAAPTGDEAADSYVYDPADPVPTRGGTTLGLAPGVFNQSEIEQRKDMLVYTGEPLAEPLEVTGPVSLKLFAASSAPDTDFVAKLIDVRPDGYAHNLAEGVVRARFRDSLSNPAPITPGKTYEYAIDMWATSHLFKRGHRVRLEITSSNFPRYDRNPNTGHDFGVDGEKDLRTARQTIFHTASSASHLMLPVIPR